MEQLCIRHIKNGLRAIRMGTKALKDTKIPYALEKLKGLNEGLYIEYSKKIEKTQNYFDKSI